METIKLYPDSCKGCRYCVANCPKGAIGLAEGINGKGYIPVQVDKTKCICCGVCFNVCPDYVFEIVDGGGSNG